MAALIDTHLHLYREEFDPDRSAVIARARQCGVGGWIHIGYDPQSNHVAQVRAAEEGTGWATAGIHPHEAVRYESSFEQWARDRAAEGRLLAIGECGLDFYRDLSPRDRQEEAFRRQIALAKELDLPMVHHVRDAYPDVRRILEEEGLPPRRGIFHAFAGDAEFARWAHGEGYKLGIGGPLSYPRSGLPQALKELPARAFLLETDAPWLPPQPWRGRRNEPAYLRHTANCLAELLGRDLDELSDLWADELETLFRIRLPGSLRNMSPGAYPAPPADRSSKSK
jgi:TatD DNase family protein